MAKIKTYYSCQNCGHSSPKWLGHCPSCNSWNSFMEESAFPLSQASRASQDFSTLSDVREHWVELDQDLQSGSETGTKKHLNRYSTGYPELDRVLGGGLVPDSFTLLGGDPGIGKSTLLLQMARGIGEKQPDLRIFYVSGEESTDQIRARAHRLGFVGSGKIFLAAETQLEQVIASVKELKPNVLVMDSLQTFSSGELQSAPGSVSQVRDIAARLMTLAKSAGIAVWLVGHVTKEGNIAGPKTVEHMVDTVLYFEGEGGQAYRLLRTVKNRFGSTRELGVFEMDGEGLREVSNPSSLFLSDRQEVVSGTAVTALLEGSRPLLAEIQALVTPSGLAVPRRTSVGLDSARVSLIAAILEKHMKLSLAGYDLFFNVAGGLRLTEPASDLAAAAAIWSSAEEQPVPMGWFFLGEVGLTGEVRRVSQTDSRLQEARRLGFTTAVLPRGTPQSVVDHYPPDAGLKLQFISRVEELPKIILNSTRKR